MFHKELWLLLNCILCWLWENWPCITEKYTKLLWKHKYPDVILRKLSLRIDQGPVYLIITFSFYRKRSCSVRLSLPPVPFQRLFENNYSSVTKEWGKDEMDKSPTTTRHYSRPSCNLIAGEKYMRGNIMML